MHRQLAHPHQGDPFLPPASSVLVARYGVQDLPLAVALDRVPEERVESPEVEVGVSMLDEPEGGVVPGALAVAQHPGDDRQYLRSGIQHAVKSLEVVGHDDGPGWDRLGLEHVLEDHCIHDEGRLQVQ